MLHHLTFNRVSTARTCAEVRAHVLDGRPGELTPNSATDHALGEEVSTPLQAFLFAAAVAGNTIAGAVLLSILLMIPLWLERLLNFP